LLFYAVCAYLLTARARAVWISAINLIMDQVCQFGGLPGAPANIFVNGTIYCWNWQTNHSYWLKEEDYTCKDFDEGNCPCPELKADSDIAGIGVRKGPRQQSET
jgi:hypothetical protein